MLLFAGLFGLVVLLLVFSTCRNNRREDRNPDPGLGGATNCHVSVSSISDLAGLVSHNLTILIMNR